LCRGRRDLEVFTRNRDLNGKGKQVANNTVSIRVTYECGRCANRVVRVLKTTEDGLLEVPAVYCGRCIKGTRLSQMSVTMSEGKVIEPVETTSEQDATEKEGAEK
jgi:hypothetical protein